jgi:hypothetical protein
MTLRRNSVSLEAVYIGNPTETGYRELDGLVTDANVLARVNVPTFPALIPDDVDILVKAVCVPFVGQYRRIFMRTNWRTIVT